MNTLMTVNRNRRMTKTKMATRTRTHTHTRTHKMAEKKRQKDGANYRQAYYAKFRLISRQKGAEQKQKGNGKAGK